MKCDQFQYRLDLLLDQRRDVRQDTQLRDHARGCQTCHESLQIWCTIDEVVAPGEPVALDHRAPNTGLPAALRSATGAWAAAAAILLCVAIAGRWLPLGTPETAALASVAIEQPLKHHVANDQVRGASTQTPQPLQPSVTLDWQTSQWWSAMSDEPWVHHTLPAVNSVRIGVAPIGRSMKQAIAILMIQSNATTIDDPSLTPASQTKPFQDQTSTVDPGIGFASVV